MEPDHEILTNRQIILLQQIADNAAMRDTFYLTGGTALAGFYLHHRLSEDLDFFTEDIVDPQAITVFLQDIRKKLHITDIDYQQSFNRNLFFLKFSNEVVKTEFTYFPFPRIDNTIFTNNLSIDSMQDIAVNKLFTIYQQSRARDYIDLYCILREKAWRINELVDYARIKFDMHIDYLQLGTQFIKACDAEDMPHMIQQIPKKEWRNFFVDEAKKLKDKVIRE
jgi:predicted nucleotidyltransferase component of viral defense system